MHQAVLTQRRLVILRSIAEPAEPHRRSVLVAGPGKRLRRIELETMIEFHELTGAPQGPAIPTRATPPFGPPNPAGADACPPAM